ncbi:hypothetical protein SAMN04488548_1025 [Gordonia westfalica]|uniref:Uncharacterized protein n=1 Tax=Gordonia westfalica TaxID=158898 RepID=A0A1H2DLG4_9ACTN|nr:hypothetical protein SAMN04488548_1025 [Gordonia westfalica]
MPTNPTAEARLSVWFSEDLASKGIAASVKHSDITGDITGDRHYYVTGPTWLISLDQNAVMAGQIAGQFGGELVKSGDI